MVFDCRFLKNPNWVETLKNSDGTKKDVSAYIRKDKSWAIFRDYLKGMVLHVIPAFEKEGKYYLSIGFGCTGGRHRSVFVSQFLYDELKKRKLSVELMQGPSRHANAGDSWYARSTAYAAKVGVPKGSQLDNKPGGWHE